MRVLVVAAFLLTIGCHGTDLRVGTGHTFDDGQSLGSVSGKHETGGSWLVEDGGSSSLWMEVGFQLTPQTVVLRDERVQEHVLYPTPPPTVTDFEAKSVPPVIQEEPITEDPDIDWEEVVVAVALGLIPLLFGGRYAVNKVRARRAKKEG